VDIIYDNLRVYLMAPFRTHLIPTWRKEMCTSRLDKVDVPSSSIHILNHDVILDLNQL
jgi:hypothetical protein